MRLKCFSFFFVFAFSLTVKAQLNVNLNYNNKSILYEGAQGLHGLSFQVMYKTAKKSLSGFDLTFNQGKGYRDFSVVLARKPGELNYGKVPYTDEFQTKDTTLEYKQFKGKRAYVYFAFSFQHFKPLKSVKNRLHYLGFIAGFNLLSERVVVKNDNVNGKYFENNSSTLQMMLGMGYQREISLKTNSSFVYGTNLSLSAMPFTLNDYSGIISPLGTVSIYFGLRFYLK